MFSNLSCFTSRYSALFIVPVNNCSQAKGMNLSSLKTTKAAYFVSICCVLFLGLSFLNLCDQFNGCQHITEGATKRVDSIRIPDIYKRKGKYKINNVLIRPDKFSSKLLFLVIIKSSSADPIGQERRDAIRKTWGNCNSKELQMALSSGVKLGHLQSSERDELEEYKGCKLIFYLGRTRNEYLNEKVRKEAENHGDVLLTDVYESYSNMTLKLRTCLGHVAAAQIQAKYVVKVDNDVHVSLPNLIEYLTSKQDLPRYLYGGKPKYGDIVIRDPKSKWYVRMEDYSETVYYPVYCMGLMYVMSGNVIDPLVKVLSHIKPLNTDDCYIGIAMKKLGVTPVKINRIDRYLHRSTVLEFLQICDFSYFIALGDSLLPSELFDIQNIIKFSRTNPTWYCWHFQWQENLLLITLMIVLYFSSLKSAKLIFR